MVPARICNPRRPNMGEKRDAYVQKLKGKLDEWNTEIDKLQAKSEQIKADAKDAVPEAHGQN